MRDLAGGAFIAQQRNVVLVGGTGTGKTHLAIAIARSRIRAGSRGRFFTTVDLVNQLEAESRAAIVIVFSGEPPSFVRLALDVGLRGLTLVIEGVEVLLETRLGGDACVNGAA